MSVTNFTYNLMGWKLVCTRSHVANVTIFPGFPSENSCHWRWKNFPFGVRELSFRILAISFHDLCHRRNGKLQ